MFRSFEFAFNEHLVDHNLGASAKIRERLGYREPVALEEAIQRTIAWERKNPPAGASFHQFDYVAEDAAD